MTNENQILQLDELTIQVLYDGDQVNILWQGISEIQDPEISVGKFLQSLIPSLIGKRLVMNFRELEYMNSATLQPLLQLLKELSSNGIESKIVYTPSVEWQRISFRSIKSITMTLPHISVVSE